MTYLDEKETISTTANPSPESTDLGYGQILATIWRRRYWFLVAFFTVFSIGGLLALRKEPTYESYMQILVEPNYEVNPSRGELSDVTENSVEVDYSTQLNLMRSSQLLQKAVERLQADYPNLTINTIRNKLSLERVLEGDVETKIFQANYESQDPLKAKRVLEEILKVYQEYNLEQQNQRLAEGLSFTNQQIAVVRENLTQMEANLKRFRTENGWIFPEEKAQSLSTRLDNIEQEREQVRSEYQGTLAQYEALKARLGRSTPSALAAARLSESALYQNLTRQLQENEVALGQERARFTDESPTVQNLLRERQNLAELLSQERANLLQASAGRLNATELSRLGFQDAQLGSTELELVEELVATEALLTSLVAQDQSLVQAESRLRSILNQFPLLLDQYESLLQEIEVKRNTLQQLLEAQQELGIELNRGGFNWQVVEPPLAGSQIAPNRQQDFLLSGVVALFVGGIAVYLREMLDSAIRSSEQLKQRTSLPLIGAVPKWQSLPKNRPWQSLPLYSTAQAHNALSSLSLFQWRPFRESLDLIYKNIQLLGGQPSPKSLTVTSTLVGEGKSTLVIGLALSASRLNQRVLVIDGNLRQPSLHKKLNIPNEEGLADFLSGAVKSPSVQTLTILNSQFDLLTAGSPIQDPVKLLSSEGMEALLKNFEQHYDLVLVDTPAVLGVADTIQVASYTQAVVLIGGLEQVNPSELKKATSLLERLNLIGIIANGTKDTKEGGHYPSLSDSLSSLSRSSLNAVGYPRHLTNGRTNHAHSSSSIGEVK